MAFVPITSQPCREDHVRICSLRTRAGNADEGRFKDAGHCLCDPDVFESWDAGS